MLMSAPRSVMALAVGLVEMTVAPAPIESVPTPSSPVPSAFTSAASEIVPVPVLYDGARLDREIAGRPQVHVAVDAGGVDPRNLDACRRWRRCCRCRPRDRESAEREIIAGQRRHQRADVVGQS